MFNNILRDYKCKQINNTWDHLSFLEETMEIQVQTNSVESGILAKIGYLC